MHESDPKHGGQVHTPNLSVYFERFWKRFQFEANAYSKIQIEMTKTNTSHYENLHYDTFNNNKWQRLKP